MKKVCNVCREKKELCDFVMDKVYKDGFSNRCKQCEKEIKRIYYIKNKEKRLSYMKEYSIKNKEKILSQTKEYRINNREKRKEYNIKNKEKQQSYNKEYRIKNREKRSEYVRNRRLNDYIFKLSSNVRIRLYLYLKTTGITKSKRTFDIVGCSPPELKDYLEKKFTDGMSWDNHAYNGWHIDHIIPLSSANTEEEIYKLAHYTNLQPLWAEDNFKKSNKSHYLL